ncbi:MAG: nuclear transport factor 2 family protein [Myxococcota bacterium]
MSDASSQQALVERLAALEARVARAEAQGEILALKSRYGALADARYSRRGPRPQPEIDRVAEQLAALFTEDAVWEGGGALGRCEGRAAIRERFRLPTLHYAWHFFVKPEIRVEGERASGTWDVLALVTTLEGRAMWMIGVEHDEYARVDGHWLHTRMQLDAQLMAPHDRGWATPATRPGGG